MRLSSFINKNTVVLLTIVGVATLILCCFLNSSGPRASLRIALVGYTTNSGSNITSWLSISNDGYVALRMQRSCTEYWVDSEGRATDLFIELPAAYLLPIGSNQVVGIPLQSTESEWRSTFSCNPVPTDAQKRTIAAQRAIATSCGFHFRSWADQLIIYFGPSIQALRPQTNGSGHIHPKITTKKEP